MRNITNYKKILLDNASYDQKNLLNTNVNFKYDFKVNKDNEKLLHFAKDFLGETRKIDLDSIKKLTYKIYSFLNKGNNDYIKMVKKNNISALKIIEMTAQYKIESNCLMHAVVLNEIMLSLGIFSRVIFCRTSCLKNNNCHCVNIIWLNQWIMVDSINNVICFNNKGMPLGIKELRRMLLNDERIIIPCANRDFYTKYIEYWYEYGVWFHCCLESKIDMFNDFKNSINVSLVSKKFMMQIDDISENEIVLKNESVFWATPR